MEIIQYKKSKESAIKMNWRAKILGIKNCDFFENFNFFFTKFSLKQINDVFKKIEKLLLIFKYFEKIFEYLSN